MDRKFIITSILLLLFIAESRSQFFDFFGFPPVAQGSDLFGNEHTTRRSKISTIKHTNTHHAKNTSLSREETDRDGHIQTPREKKRKQTTLFPTLAPIFNFFSTTQRNKKNKNHSSHRNNNTSNISSENKRTGISNDVLKNGRLAFDVDVSKISQLSNWYERPENVISDDARNYYEVTTKPYNDKAYNNNNNNYNNGNNNYNNEYTTKNPFFNRPGVKPAVVDNRPPITNKPVTKRPVTTSNPVTNKPVTARPYVVNPIPTDAGAVVFPNEEDQPEIIKGLDEDYMSDAEKRRYIEISERMCDKYKSLSTQQLSAIPLVPSPQPVRVNVSKCAPTTVPLVVGGKVVSIREFPHTALLGWVKIDGGGYSWKCGGSLVSDRWILTAAHCSYQERDNTVVSGPPRVVQLGSTYLDDPGALVVRVAAVVRHPKYKFPRSYYDIALLKLAQPVSFSEVIKPACLGVPPPVRSPIIAVGWGKTEFGGDQSLELRAVSLPVWEMSRCAEVLGVSRKMPQGPSADSQLCAGEERGGKDTCQGDSGGPAQIQDGCVWRVVAVTSLGRSCGAPNTPGLYALVHRPFIAATIYGDYKNNNRRSDNSENNNYDNSQESSYNNNNNRRTTTTTEVYYNNQNQNRRPVDRNNDRRTDNSQSNNNYGNSQESSYNNNNRRTTTTTTEVYNNDYNNNRNQNRRPDYDYGNQNKRPETSSHENNNQNNKRTTSTTESYYNYNNQNKRPETDSYDYNNQHNNGFVNNKKTTTTTEAYHNYNNNQNNGQNRKTTTVQPYYQNKRTTTTTESYQSGYYNNNQQPNYESNSRYDNQDYYNTNHKQNHHTTPKTNNNPRTDYERGYYNPNNEGDYNRNGRNGNNDYWNNQPQNDDYGRNVDRYERGRIWWTKK